MQTVELESLIHKAVGGDADARGQLVQQVSERLLNLTRLMLRSDFLRLRRWEETDDVYQNALIRLDRSLGSACPQSTAEFYGLATTQIRRTLLDLARHYYGPEGEAANRVSIGDQSDTDPIANSPTTNQSLESLAQWTRLHEVVETMPDAEREAFSMVWYGGMTQERAASVLGISRRTLIRRVNRARITIYRELSGVKPSHSESAN